MNTFWEFIIMFLIACVMNFIIIFTFAYGFGIDVGPVWGFVIGCIDMEIVMVVYNRIKRRRE